MKTIRLWKLGHLNKENPMNSIIPSKSMLERVKNILVEATKSKEDVLDIIWGPDLNLEIHTLDGEVEDYVVGTEGKLIKVE